MNKMIYIYFLFFAYALYRHYGKAQSGLDIALEQNGMTNEDISELKPLLIVFLFAYVVLLFIICVPLTLLDARDYLRNE